jgi:hypothetical protein
MLQQSENWCHGNNFALDENNNLQNISCRTRIQQRTDSAAASAAAAAHLGSTVSLAKMVDLSTTIVFYLESYAEKFTAIERAGRVVVLSYSDGKKKETLLQTWDWDLGMQNIYS